MQTNKKLFKKYKWAKKNNNNLLFGYISMTSAGFSCYTKYLMSKHINGILLIMTL